MDTYYVVFLTVAAITHGRGRMFARPNAHFLVFPPCEIYGSSEMFLAYFFENTKPPWVSTSE